MGEEEASPLKGSTPQNYLPTESKNIGRETIHLKRKYGKPNFVILSVGYKMHLIFLNGKKHKILYIFKKILYKNRPCRCIGRNKLRLPLWAFPNLRAKQ